MPEAHTINIANQTDEKQVFQIFTDPPQVTGAVSTIWIDSLAKAPPIPPSAEVSCFLPTQYYAVCGTTDAGEIVSITTEYAQPVTLGTDDTPGSDWKVTIQSQPGGTPQFDPSETSDTHVPGGFTINTLNESWIPSQHPSAFVGLGRQNPMNHAGNVIPVATWNPKPNQTYQIRPNNVYWVVYGNLAPGRHDSVFDLGVVPFRVDFTGQSTTVANLVLEPDYTFTLAFGAGIAEVPNSPPETEVVSPCGATKEDVGHVDKEGEALY